MNNKRKAAVTELIIFRGTLSKSKRIAVKERDFYSISYRYHGKVWLKTTDTELISEANSITFMPQNTRYETEVLDDTEMVMVHFNVAKDIDFRNPAVISANDNEIPHLFEKLVRRAQVGSSVSFSTMATFYELLSKLEMLEHKESKEMIPHKISQARDEILQKFSDPLFSIETLADSIGVSTSYLRREFSRAYSKSPIAFLKEIRIKNSKMLLHSGYMSIAEIAKQSGFSSASYFIQVFHKTVGCSPSKYREETSESY